jgi:hypothetical protein
VLLTAKNPSILRLCFEKCTKHPPKSSLSMREEACLETCTRKLLNAHSFCVDIIEQGGVRREHSAIAW